MWGLTQGLPETGDLKFFTDTALYLQLLECVVQSCLYSAPLSSIKKDTEFARMYLLSLLLQAVFAVIVCTTEGTQCH